MLTIDMIVKAVGEQSLCGPFFPSPQGRKRSVMHRDTRRSSGTVLSPLDAPRNPFAVELEGMLYGLKLRDLLVVVMEGSGVRDPVLNSPSQHICR